jgi:hypothetical protein
LQVGSRVRARARLAILVAALVAAAVATIAQEAWPPLPSEGFIKGRTATRADVAAGRAVFAPEVGGVSVGKPLAITIPQYAYYKEGGKRTPAIVVQAEEVQGMKMVGARLGSGKAVVGLLQNFDLLGKVPPRK